jgi:hypothetical protein
VVLGRYCACEILIANPIDWLYAACLEYFIFFSIDSSETRKQYDEYCLLIMQTITYAHYRTHRRILIAPLVSSNSSQGYVGLCPKNIYSFWIKLFYFVKPQIIKLVFVASLLSMQHLKRKSKDSLARNQDNVFEWGD